MKRAIAMLALVACACGGYSPPPARTADRARSVVAPRAWGAPAGQPDPRAKTSSVFKAPSTSAGKLPNGIRTAYFVRHDLPIVSIDFALDRGRIDEKPGVVSVMLEMLLNGPKSRKPRLFAYFGWLGARTNAYVRSESCGITFETLSSHTTSVVLTAGEMFSSPSFDDEEVDEEKRATTAALRTSNTNVDDAASTAALASLGLIQHSDPAEVDKIVPDDIERAYTNLIGPESLVVSVVGDFDPDDMNRLLVKAFEGFSQKPKPLSRPALADKGDAFVVLDRAKSEQSAIVIVTPAPRLADPDAAAVRLAGSILAGRLQRDTREAKGYTYGASVSWSGFDSYMKVVVDVSTPRTKEALADIVAALQSMRAGVTQKEIDSARSTTAAAYTARFHTNSDAAETLANTLAAGSTPDIFYKVYDGMRDVKPDGITNAVQKWWAAPHVVIVGDATTFAGDVSTVGLGQPIVRPMP